MGSNAGTGWEREKRTHFDEIVTNYDRVRPEYPAALFKDLLQYCHTKPGDKALEIGAGTGKATAPVLAAGYDVTAVEIGANMAAFLRERFRESPVFRVLVTSFEEVSLAESGCDLIYAASAFHWVDAGIGCPKAYRLLRDGGVFALLRYNVLPADGEALYDEIQAAYEAHYVSHYTSNKKPSQKTREDFFAPSMIRSGYGFEDMSSFGFHDVTMKLYDVARTFDAKEYLAMLDTLADHRGLPEGNREALYAAIREAFARHGGRLTVDYVFQLYMGRK